MIKDWKNTQENLGTFQNILFVIFHEFIVGVSFGYGLWLLNPQSREGENWFSNCDNL